MLPFVFIFNPQLLLIGVGSWVRGGDRVRHRDRRVAAVRGGDDALVPHPLHAGSRSALLLVATFLFFRPDWVIDRFAPKYVSAPAADIYKVADTLGQRRVAGRRRSPARTSTASDMTKTVAMPMGEGANGRERLRDGGVTLAQLGNDIEVANVKFGSRARKLGVEQGYKIAELKLPNPDAAVAALGAAPGGAAGGADLVAAGATHRGDAAELCVTAASYMVMAPPVSKSAAPRLQSRAAALPC